MEFKSDVLGLALLGSISAFSIWSAANPSVFTISQFTTEKSKENARLGMNIGIGLCGALSAGLYLAYGKKGTMPALLTGATGVGLYALYDYMLGNSHLSNPEKKTMPEQFEAMQAGGGQFPGGQGPTNIISKGGASIGQFPGGSGPIYIGDPDPGLEGGEHGGGGGGGGEVGHPGAIYGPGAPGPGGGGGGSGYYDYALVVPGGAGGAGGGGSGGGGGQAGGGGGQNSGGAGGEGGGEGGGTVGFYDDDNFYMSKAQVKASGWPQCQGCLKHGRTLRDCSLLGECRGPWSDGSTPDDLKMKQLRLSGLGGGYGDDGYDIVSYHAGSYPHGGKPHPVMASPNSPFRYHVDEGYSDYRGYK